jgi:L-fuculose-phosphate aldolase
MVIMYTGNIIGKANVLSCDQVGELIRLREKMGITTGGVPACAAKPTNTQDVVMGQSVSAGETPGLKTYGQGGSASPCGCAGGSDSVSEAELKQITEAMIARLSGKRQ